MGTDGDDEFLVTPLDTSGPFDGGDGNDTIVLQVDQGTGFFNFLTTSFSSIEALRFGGPAGTVSATLWNYASHPLAAPGFTITGGAGITSIAFTTSLAVGNDFMIPTLNLVNWRATDLSSFIALSSGSTTAVTLRANAAVAAVQVLTGGLGDDTLIGHDGIDILFGGDGADTLSALGGDDVIRLFAVPNSFTDQRNDTVDGGSGQDILSVQGNGFAQVLTNVEHLSFQFSNLSVFNVAFQTSLHAGFLSTVNVVGTEFGIVSVNLDDRNDFDLSGVTFNDQVFNGTLVASDNEVMFEVFGNGNANTLIGTGHRDDLYGAGGVDVLIGGEGDDQLYGGTGNDFLYGGLGDDGYYVDSAADLVFENALGGYDVVVAEVGYYLFANVEELTLAPGAGNIFGVGNGLDNIMSGNEGNNLLIGGDGFDRIYGVFGNDALFGQDGADSLYGDTGIDYLVGGTGDDTLDGGEDADALYGEDGNDTLDGGTGFFTDILVGGAGNDILDGDSGLQDYDIMNGGDGDDLYRVDTGDDLTFEAVGGGTDTVYADVAGTNNGVYLYANVENLVLLGQTAFGVGNDLANVLTGSIGSNWLLGGAGNDTLNGLQGNDVLFGEGAFDTFVFQPGTGADLIGDFISGRDLIDLTDFQFASFTQLQTVFIQNGDTGAINLGNGDIVVLLNTQMAALTENDFLL